MLLVLLLAACTRDPGSAPTALPDDCATFDEMGITDPDGVASENDFARVRYVVDELASASGLDGICVPELRFDESGACGPDENCFRGVGEPILLGSSSVWEVREVMCEALAEGLGFDARAPELFASTNSFVRACQEFPAYLTLQASTDGTCAASSIEASREQAAWLLAEVFPHWDVPLGDPVEVTLDRRGVVGLEGELGSFFGSGGAFYAWESAEGAAPADAVVRIDPDTFEVAARYPLPVRPGDSIRRLIPTDTTPILVYASVSEGVQAWRLEGDAWVSTPFSAFGNGDPFYAAAADGTAWLFGYPTSSTVALVSVDLATGESTPLTGVDLLSAEHLVGDATGLVGGAQTGLLEHVHVLVDPAAGTYEAVPVPYDWHVTYPVGLDGRVAGVWSANDLASIVIYAPDTDTWHLAADPCGEARIEGGVYPATLDGEAWFHERDDAAPGGAWMTRVLVHE